MWQCWNYWTCSTHSHTVFQLHFSCGHIFKVIFPVRCGFQRVDLQHMEKATCWSMPVFPVLCFGSSADSAPSRVHKDFTFNNDNASVNVSGYILNIIFNASTPLQHRKQQLCQYLILSNELKSKILFPNVSGCGCCYCTHCSETNCQLFKCPECYLKPASLLFSKEVITSNYKETKAISDSDLQGEGKWVACVAKTTPWMVKVSTVQR